MNTAITGPLRMNKIEAPKPIIRTSLTQVIGKNQMQEASVTRDKLIQAIGLLNQIVDLISTKPTPAPAKESATVPEATPVKPGKTSGVVAKS